MEKGGIDKKKHMNMGTWDGKLNIQGCLQEGSHGLDKAVLEVCSKEKLGEGLFGDSV